MGKKNEKRAPILWSVVSGVQVDWKESHCFHFSVSKRQSLVSTVCLLPSEIHTAVLQSWYSQYEGYKEMVVEPAPWLIKGWRDLRVEEPLKDRFGTPLWPPLYFKLAVKNPIEKSPFPREEERREVGRYLLLRADWDLNEDHRLDRNVNTTWSSLSN